MVTALVGCGVLATVESPELQPASARVSTATAPVVLTHTWPTVPTFYTEAGYGTLRQ